jgi:hypothetical protein
MTIGAGLFLIAVGAILRFGITTAYSHGFSVHTIGDIFMGIGVLGVVLWLVIWAPWTRRSRSGLQEPRYREPAPGEPRPARARPADEHSYEDQYPR